jgi:hypothetical protein
MPDASADGSDAKASAKDVVQSLLNQQLRVEITDGESARRGPHPHERKRGARRGSCAIATCMH